MSLINCIDKVYGKLVSKEDADALMRDVYALQDRGLTPIEAERQAVDNALRGAIQNGESILRQIHAQRPEAHDQARAFWDKQTNRTVGDVPLPKPVSIEQHAQNITDAHNSGSATEGGSTVNAVHGNLADTQNHSVSIFPDLTTYVPGRYVTPEQIKEFAAKVQAAGVDLSQPNVSIGTWYDREANATSLDVAYTTNDRSLAIDLGRQFNQKAIFDLLTLSEVPTGGTGENVGGLPPIRERLDYIAHPGYSSPTHEAIRSDNVGEAQHPSEGSGGGETPAGTGRATAGETAQPGGEVGGHEEVGGIQQGEPGGYEQPAAEPTRATAEPPTLPNP